MMKSNYISKLYWIPGVACVVIASIIKNNMIAANKKKLCSLYRNSKPIIAVSKIKNDFPIQFTRWDTQHCPDNDKIMESNALDENKKQCLWE